ncbi:MAG: alpha/beta hydrolase [Myxococcota bacterium]|nr:alpha/beta hydrolase [Myxococcota bacterium]
MVSFSERRVQAFGLALCVRSVGGDPVTSPAPWVLLHGFMDQAASWDGVARCLSATGPVLSPDQRGFGLSDHVGPGGYYHFSDYLLDLEHLLANLGLERVRLVGHSMGATIASMFAAVRPERVESLQLVDGLGPAHTIPEAAADQLAQHVQGLRSPKTHRVLESIEAAAQRMLRALPALSEAEALRLARRGTREVDGGFVWRWDPLHRSRGATGFDGARYKVLLDRIQAPTRVILSERGWVRTLPDMDERLRRLGAEVVPWAGGHNPHIEDPDALAQMLLAPL